MARRSLSVFASALGLAFVAGCGGSETVRQDAEATVTAAATVTALPTETTPPVESTPPSTIREGLRSGLYLGALYDLVGGEYSPGTSEDIARAICEEARTGDRDSSFQWREMIGDIGERRVGAFIAYSVATYCPEDDWRLIGLVDGSLGHGG